MKKIFYSLCGEGYGHATRALSVIKNIDAEFHVFTYGKALSFINKQAPDNVKTYEIKGPEFVRVNDSISQFKTALEYAKYLAGKKTDFPSETPDLCISDWELSLASFAEKKDVPIIQIASQFKFLFNKRFNINPFHTIISLMCELHRGDHYIVPSFQFSFVQESETVTPTFALLTCRLLIYLRRIRN
jgi:uncharacterized protein (TIGR00661 family)